MAKHVYVKWHLLIETNHCVTMLDQRSSNYGTPPTGVTQDSSVKRRPEERVFKENILTQKQPNNKQV